MNHWGYLQSIDLFDCPKNLLQDKEFIASFLKRLCKAIKMVPYGEPIVDKFGEGSLEGISGVLFITTSSITIHCDDLIGNRCFIDVFSCKAFDHVKALSFVLKYFRTSNYKQCITTRG